LDVRARSASLVVIALTAVALALLLITPLDHAETSGQLPASPGHAGQFQASQPAAVQLPHSELLEAECPPLDPHGIKKLRLVYQVDEAFYDYGSGELWARPGEAEISLVVDVVRVEGGFRVTFTLSIVGEVIYFVNMSRGLVNVTRSVTLLYTLEEGYCIPGGEKLGRVFPLFTGGEELVLEMLWAKVGERFSEGIVRPVRLRGGLTSVWDLEKGLAVSQLPSGSYLVCNLSEEGCIEYRDGAMFRRLKLRGLIENAKLLRTLKPLSECRVFVIRRYTSMEVPGGAYVYMEVSRGIPLDLRLPDAPITRRETKVTWQGREVKELAAWPLAELLGLRMGEVHMRLVEVRVGG